MEPIIIIYIGTMTIVGLLATNIVCKNYSNNLTKKKFKHYRFH